MGIRALYTASSGMLAQMRKMNVLANNIANTDTTAYKKDMAITKAFPELLIKRLNDDGVYKFPLGSYDKAPIVGKLGTGVEYNETFTDFSSGTYIQTNNTFDLALNGEGFFVIDTPNGERYTRNGSFILGKEGILETLEGFPLLGKEGLIRLEKNNFKINELGEIFINPNVIGQTLGEFDNDWTESILLDQIELVNFDDRYDAKRYLIKEGRNLWKDSELSGPASALIEADRPSVRQGFLEGSNVNAVKEMVQMIAMNRAYQANQKTLTSVEQLTQKFIDSSRI